MNKRIQQKKAKQAETQKPQTIQEAWDVLYDLLKQDPEWSSRTACMFVQNQWGGREPGYRGRLYTVSPEREILTTKKFRDY